jgi:hypothetical protein
MKDPPDWIANDQTSRINPTVQRFGAVGMGVRMVCCALHRPPVRIIYGKRETVDTVFCWNRLPVSPTVDGIVSC